MILLRAVVMKDMDKLEHSKADGFYDRELDMFFEELSAWARYKYGICLSQIHA